MAYSSEDNAVMHVAALMPDYLGIQSAYRRILVRKKREAPALFKFRRYYLLLTSGCTGWEPNRAEIFYATCAPAPSSFPNPATRTVNEVDPKRSPMLHLVLLYLGDNLW